MQEGTEIYTGLYCCCCAGASRVEELIVVCLSLSWSQLVSVSLSLRYSTGGSCVVRYKQEEE